MPLSQLAVTESKVTSDRPIARETADAARATRADHGAPHRSPAPEAMSRRTRTTAPASTGAQREGSPRKTPTRISDAVTTSAIPKTTDARRESMRGRKYHEGASHQVTIANA